MADTLRVKRRAAGGAAGPPAALAAAEIAFNEQDSTLYYGAGNSAGAATSIFPIAGPGAFLRLSGGILSGGVSFGSAVAPGGNSDLSRHIALFGTGYGIGVTSGRVNYVSAGAQVFVSGTTDKVTINNNGITMAPATAITLAADPTAALQASSKQYVDARAWQEAPNSVNVYGRSSLAWTQVPNYTRVTTDSGFDLDTISGSAAIGSYTNYQGVYSIVNQTAGVNFPPGARTASVLNLWNSNPAWINQLAFTVGSAAVGGVWTRWTNGSIFNAWQKVITDAGGTLNGALILAADPTTALGAASKQYVDNGLAGSVVSFNARTGAVALTLADLTGVGGAPLASPTFTGTVTIPGGTINATSLGAVTPSTGAFTTLAASGAISGAGFTALLAPYALVSTVPGASTTNPVMDGTVAVGAGTTWARADHAHPSDTSRFATAGGTLSGGMSFGSALAPGGNADLSRHIALFGAGYGIGITSGRINYVAAGAHVFGNGTTDRVTINSLGITMAASTAITLAADPTTALQASSKQYVDARASPIIATIAALRAATTATLGTGQCVVQSFAGTTNKGGGTFIYVSTDTTSADNTGTVIVDASGRRWYRLGRADDLCSVHWWGAVGDGATNDAAPLNAAFASGLSLYMPAGTYNVTGPLTCACIGQRIEGSGEMVTTISTNQATGDVLTLTGSDIDIGSIGFTATVARTAGAMINLGNTSQVRLHDFYMTAFFVGVSIGVLGSGGGNTVYVERGILLTTVASGYGVQVNSGVVLVLRDLLIEGNNATQSVQLTAGVVVFGVGDLTLDHVSTIWAGHGLEVPLNAANAVCQALWVINCFFDTGSGYGIYVNAAGASSNVQEIKIADCWIASNALGGIALTTSSTGVIQQCDVLDTVSSNNTGHGISITGARVANTRILGCSIGSNTAYSGVWIDANVSYFQVIGNWLGASGEFLGNAAGITINNNCDHFTVSDNIFNGNATTFNMGTFSGIPGVSFWISHNHGIITRYFGAMVTTAGPSAFTVTHGLAWTPLLPNIRLTLGSGLGAAKYFYPTNVTATTFQIAFDVAPGAGVTVNWEASVLGG